jgi:hypothetical protein
MLNSDCAGAGIVLIRGKLRIDRDIQLTEKPEPLGRFDQRSFVETSKFSLWLIFFR